MFEADIPDGEVFEVTLVRTILVTVATVMFESVDGIRTMWLQLSGDYPESFLHSVTAAGCVLARNSTLVDESQ